MKFKIGNMVEVLSKKDNLGAWRCAQIVAHNGDGYTIKYIRGSGAAKDSVNKVSYEAVRPCPRQTKDSQNWVVGDVVEVLDDGYWRVSMIDDVLEDGYYYIRVIGSLDEFKVKNSNIRARQEWELNKWVFIDKVSEHRVDLSSRMHNKSYVQSQSNLTKVLGVPESDLLSKSLKRSSPDHSSMDDDYSKFSLKRRVIEKEVELDACSFIGKVDKPANQKGNLAKNDVQNCIEKTIRFNNVNSRNHDDFKSLGRTPEVDDCVSTVSSVASCSITNDNPDRLLSHSYSGYREDSASLCSDADSHSHSYLGTEEEMSDSQLEREDSLRTHELDIYGYRRVLESLYASGPLSWEQEIALTNLRMKLYVSNDEHLIELRRLKSIGALGLSCH